LVQQQIASTTLKQTDVAEQMRVAALVGDTNGTNLIRAQQLAGFNLGDPVIIIDNSNLPSQTFTILAISGLVVTLNQAVIGYTLAQAARLIKLL
jgi:hypothetical protein